MRIAGFELNERLYEGQSTLVYAGVRTADQLPVVAKLVLGSLRDLRREHALVLRVAGEGVVEALGVHDSSDGPVLVQRRFGDCTLAKLCAAGPVPLVAALQVALQLTRVLTHLHRARVLHRDIKPANVLYDSVTGRIALADFGIAVELPINARSIMVTDLVGTPAYIAPEQTGRLRQGCDARSDVYAVGITLYELLTGVLPFDGQDTLEQIAAQLSKTPAAPDQLNPAIPRALSAIVMKAIAKQPAERYQSAKGLGADLARCLHALEAGERVPDFELAQADPFLPEFPAQLFGRSEAIASLRAAHAQASAGKAGLVVLSGRAGSGRSQVTRALVASMPQLQSGVGAWQEGGERPLAAIALALGSIAERWLALEDAELGTLRGRALGALGRVGQALIEMAPELASVLGPQPELAELGPTQARARLRHAFRSFLAAIGGELASLLVLEDGEHADAASLDLIESLLSASERTPVLVVITVSSPEALAELRARHGGKLIELPALSAADVQAWTAATLQLPVAELQPLAAALYEKSGGNPGMLVRLIEHFVDSGLLDREGGRFRWDIERVRAARAPQSLVAQLGERVRELPEALRELLGALAFHELPAPVATLAAMLGQSPESCAKLLAKLEAEGLVTAKSERFSIAHPSVARAAALECSEERRSELGRRLLQQAFTSLDDEQLGAQAYVLVRALAEARLELDAAERTRAARLYRLAGAQASAAMAYTDAAAHFSRGRALLGDTPQGETRGLWMELAVAHSRALMMLKQNEQSEQLLQQLCAYQLSPEEVTLVYQTRIDNLSNIMERSRAVDVGIEGLRRVGVVLPENPTPQEPFVQLQKNEARLGSLSAQEIVAWPEMNDPSARAAMSLLSTMMPPASFAGRSALWVLIGEMAIEIVLDHGRERFTASFLVAHAMMMQGVMKNYPAARRYYAAALALEEAAPAFEIGGRTYLAAGYYLSAWFEPPRAAMACLEKGMQLGTEAGDALYTALIASAQLSVSMLAGVPLDRVLSQLESRLGILQGDGGVWANASNVRNLCQKLTSGAPIEAEDLAKIGAVPKTAGSMRSNAMVNFGLALSVIGCEAQVRAWIEEIAPAFGLTNLGQPQVATLRLLEGMFAAKDAQAGAPERLALASKALEELRGYETKIGVTHHRPAICLLEAEIAWASGDADLASARFGRAAAAAQREEMVQLVALAHERRAQLLEAEQEPDEAALHVREAYLAYKRWGHLTKAQQLEAAHPDLRTLSGAGQAHGHTRTRNGSVTMAATMANTHTTAINDALDLSTVLRVSQEISTELQAASVVQRVLSGIVQSAGAERALWVQLEAAGTERALAELAGGSYHSLDLPLSQYHELPESVARVVRRTAQPLVVADALNDPTHKQDAFVSAHGCRSIACIPVSRKGQLSGFVLLENRLVAGAFTPQLVNLTRALVAQAAISLDNASLYADMEARVKERTLALHERNEKMRLVLDNVSEGLFLVDRDGRLSSERSAVLARFFPQGVPSHIAGFFEHDPKLAQTFQLNWEQLLDGFLPLSLCIYQLPHQLVRGESVYELSWEPLCDEREELRSLLVVMRDVTDARRRAQAELQQKQLMVIFEKILADQQGVTAFVQETDRLVLDLERGSERPEVEKRFLHTLKGNTAIFGLSSFSQECHELENVLESDARRMNEHDRALLRESWQRTRTGFERFLNAQKTGLHVPLPEYQAALARLQQDRHSLAGDLALWRLESARSHFERLADQAQKLAARVHKTPLQVEIEDGSVYFADGVWTRFWSAFVHVLRNAIDHGLESPEERHALGKGPGTLRLRAQLEHTGFVLELGDDGRGIAWERLRDKARAAGLASQTHDDLLAALFTDGITTKDAATELSGRGVGLAAVRAACEEMHAQIQVSSSSGQGTTWRFVFPADVVRVPRSVQQRLRQSA